MKISISVFASLTLSLMLGCNSVKNENPFKNDNKSDQTDPFAPCTDAQTCCTSSEKICSGSLDNDNLVCVCPNLWSCDGLNSNKCHQPKRTPDGSTKWKCEWSEFKYSCSQAGTQDNPPAGRSGWNCAFNNEFWTCSFEEVPNPTNTPAGTNVWKCVVINEMNDLQCQRTEDTPSSDGGVTPGNDGGSTTNDSGTTVPGGHGQWNCATNEIKLQECDKVDSNKGLPTGTGTWSCVQTEMKWICDSPKSGNPTVPSGTGKWVCEETEFSIRCSKDKGPEDVPNGTGKWVCSKGSEFGGTHCEEVNNIPPDLWFPTGSEVCVPGTQRWCDGLQFCGWGVMTCKPDGTWPTKMHNGKLMYDCQERADGKVPNTTCACHHFYFNPTCCERADCIVPDNTDGQLCQPSAGKLCDYCNPQNVTCQGQGSQCIIHDGETFCGKSCGKDSDCPSDYFCAQLVNNGVKQCVPKDLSCFF